MPTTKYALPTLDTAAFIDDFPSTFTAAMNSIDSLMAVALTGVRPAAGKYGRFFLSAGGLLSFDNGAAWVDINPVDLAAATASLRTLGTGSQQAAAGNHTHAGLAADQSAAVASIRTLGAGALQAAAGNHTHTGLTADQAAGTASVRTLGTGALQAAAGNHAHAGLTADQPAGVASVRTLGAGSQQAAPGNDARFQDALKAQGTDYAASLGAGVRGVRLNNRHALMDWADVDVGLYANFDPSVNRLKDTAKPGWAIDVGLNDRFAIYRAAPTVAAPVWTVMGTVSSTGVVDFIGQLRTAGVAVVYTNDSRFNADQAAGVASPRTLGSGSLQAAKGSDFAAHAALGEAAHPLIERAASVGLPTTGLVDGMRVRMQLSGTVHWLFLYDASGPRWNFVGGPPLVVVDSATQTGSPGAVGPTITFPLAGDYIVEVGGTTWHSETQVATEHLQFRRGDGTVVGPDLRHSSGGADWFGTVQQVVSNPITVAKDVAMNLKQTCDTPQGRTSDRWIKATPVYAT